MFNLIKSLTAKEVLYHQLPAIGTSLIISEFVYHFQSFTLECLAFLATWYAVDWITRIKLK